MGQYKYCLSDIHIFSIVIFYKPVNMGQHTLNTHCTISPVCGAVSSAPHVDIIVHLRPLNMMSKSKIEHFLLYQSFLWTLELGK